jgi:hypothetical protein
MAKNSYTDHVLDVCIVLLYIYAMTFCDLRNIKKIHILFSTRCVLFYMQQDDKLQI